MSLCLFNIYMDAVMKEVNMGMGKAGSEIRGEWKRVVEIAGPFVYI